MEWDYGGFEGMTAAQIRRTRPGWHLWRDGVVPGDAEHPGEQLHQVAARTDAVLNRVRPLLSGGDVALVAHGHLQRVLTARWLGLVPSAGRSEAKRNACKATRLLGLLARRTPSSPAISAGSASTRRQVGPPHRLTRGSHTYGHLTT